MYQVDRSQKNITVSFSLEKHVSVPSSKQPLYRVCSINLLLSNSSQQLSLGIGIRDGTGNLKRLG